MNEISFDVNTEKKLRHQMKENKKERREGRKTRNRERSEKERMRGTGWVQKHHRNNGEHSKHHIPHSLIIHLRNNNMNETDIPI